MKVKFYNNLKCMEVGNASIEDEVKNFSDIVLPEYCSLFETIEEDVCVCPVGGAPREFFDPKASAEVKRYVVAKKTGTITQNGEQLNVYRLKDNTLEIIDNVGTLVDPSEIDENGHIRFKSEVLDGQTIMLHENEVKEKFVARFCTLFVSMFDVYIKVNVTYDKNLNSTDVTKVMLPKDCFAVDMIHFYEMPYEKYNTRTHELIQKGTLVSIDDPTRYVIGAKETRQGVRFGNGFSSSTDGLKYVFVHEKYVKDGHILPEYTKHKTKYCAPDAKAPTLTEEYKGGLGILK